MKTMQDYQMFFQGYLEALTDIDGDQREFGINVKFFSSSDQEHLNDIQNEFEFNTPIEIVFSKNFRNFYRLEKILKELLFIKFLNGAQIPPESIEDFRDYVVFHLMDYIDFAFDDAAYRLGKRKNFTLIASRDKKVNHIFLIMSAEGKKLIFSFYHNKKYITNEAFDSWYQQMLANEEEHHVAAVKDAGIRGVNSFLYKEYDKEKMLDLAEALSICIDRKSPSIEKISASNQWGAEELIPLLQQGLNELYQENLPDINEIAIQRILGAIVENGVQKERGFQQVFDQILLAIEEYNQKFHTLESRRIYAQNNRYGISLSKQLHSFLCYFEAIIENSSNDKEVANALKKEYQKDSMLEVWKSVFEEIKEPINIKGGLYHDFLVIERDSYSHRHLKDYLQNIQLRLDDDFICYIYDTLKWLETLNPGRNEPCRGLCLYGITIIEGDTLVKFINILSNWIAIFREAPEELELTGGYIYNEDNLNDGQYDKLHYHRDDLIDTLQQLIDLSQNAYNNGRTLLHLGV